MGTLGNSVDKYVTGRMLRTSNDRRWSHLLAEIWSHEAGELPPQLPRDTEIAIQLRGHSLVDRRGAGMHQRTPSKKGTVWLCPAGISEDFINIENPVQECLHVYLPGKPGCDWNLLGTFYHHAPRLRIETTPNSWTSPLHIYLGYDPVSELRNGNTLTKLFS